jgi:hypothetical protein
MFVLGDACVRHINIAVVHHWATLEVAILFSLDEIKSAISEISELSLELLINWN